MPVEKEAFALLKVTLNHSSANATCLGSSLRPGKNDPIGQRLVDLVALRMDLLSVVDPGADVEDSVAVHPPPILSKKKCNTHCNGVHLFPGWLASLFSRNFVCPAAYACSTKLSCFASPIFPFLLSFFAFSMAYIPEFMIPTSHLFLAFRPFLSR